MPGLTIRGYARHRGVSHTAVRKAIAAGRITASLDGTLDPAIADQQWNSSTDLSKPRNSVIGVPKLSRDTEPVPEPATVAGPRESPTPRSEGGPTQLASSYAASRAAREGYAARLTKLDFERRSGKLVDADEVRAQLFGLTRRLRDALQGVPDRLAPILVGQTDAAKVHRLLTEEITSCLAELSAAPAIRSTPKAQS